MFESFLIASSAGCYDWPIIKQICIAIGWILAQIYEFLSLIGIANLGLCIILLTLIVKFALLPLTIKQQKFSKMQQMLQPEIKAIQNKYAGRRDSVSMQAQQQEMKEVYAKYGTSQTGGCLQTAIQMPIIIALYGVIRYIPSYIPKFSQYFENIINVIDNSADETVAAVRDIATAFADGELTERIAQLAVLPVQKWNELMSLFSGQELTTIQENYNQICILNSFCGMDLSQTPWNMIKGAFTGDYSPIGIIAILLPAIAGFGQWLSFKLTQNKTSESIEKSRGRSADPMDSMNNSMKTMGLFMPLISVFFCFTVQAGVGLYWAMSSAFQVVIQILINRKYKKMDMEEFKRVNMEKAAAKAKKRAEKGGEKGSTIAAAAAINTKNITSNEPEKPSYNSIAAKANMPTTESTEAPKIVNPNSLAAKAGLVQQYEQETGDVATTKKKYKKK